MWILWTFCLEHRQWIFFRLLPSFHNRDVSKVFLFNRGAGTNTNQIWCHHMESLNLAQAP